MRIAVYLHKDTNVRSMAELASGSAGGLVVCLNEENVPGASLPEPLEKQSVPVLKRWNQDAKKYKKNAAANSVRNSRNFLS
jgi:hypothetical protein